MSSQTVLESVWLLRPPRAPPRRLSWLIPDGAPRHLRCQLLLTEVRPTSFVVVASFHSDIWLPTARTDCQAQLVVPRAHFTALAVHGPVLVVPPHQPWQVLVGDPILKRGSRTVSMIRLRQKVQRRLASHHFFGTGFECEVPCWDYAKKAKGARINTEGDKEACALDVVACG